MLLVTNCIFVPFIVELRSVQFLLLNEYVIMLCRCLCSMHKFKHQWQMMSSQNKH